MNWKVIFHDEFLKEFETYPEHIQDAIATKALLIEDFGSQMGRPHADTLIGSKFKNMKELRLNVDLEVWRLAFAFDPKRNAILLVGADKRGRDQKRFYKRLIKKADYRFQNHIDKLKD